MPDLEDFNAFTSTTSDKSGGTSGCLPWAVGIYFLVWILCSFLADQQKVPANNG